MRKLIGNIILSILLLGQIAACQNKKTMTAEEEAKLDQEEINRPNEIWPTNKDAKGDYYYYVSLNSFPGSLGEDAGSAFITGKEKVGFLTMENDAWTTTTGAVLNDEYHPVPDSLYVRWFSLPEDKFYEGRFKMPTQVIKEHFDEMWLTYGASDMEIKADKYDRFTNLIVGITPGGGVMVWQKSSDQQIEIGHYQAHEIEMDWNKFAGINNFGDGSTRQQFIASQKNRITLPIPFGKAEKYREKYLWKCGVEVSPDLKNISLQLHMFNGEFDSSYSEYKDGTNEYKERALPKRVNFIFQDRNRKIYNFEVSFDEKDIYKAFHTVFIDKKKKADLVLVLDKDNKVFKIVLRCKTEEYVLNPDKINVSSIKYDSDISPLKDTFYGKEFNP